MISYSDISSLVKDIVRLAKKSKNQEIIEKLMDLQQLIIDVREENINLKDNIKDLNDKIKLLEQSVEIEENLEFSESGFFVKKDVEKRIPYCSHCWYSKRRLIPLSQYGNWWEYRCGECNVNVTVMDSEGRSINNKTKGEI